MKTVDNIAQLYPHYLLVTPNRATAVGFSSALENTISHDDITRMLHGGIINSAMLWKSAKLVIEEIKGKNDVLIIDDSIADKPYMDENELVCWHFDHVSGKSVKGINFLTSLYYNNGVSVPVGIEFVQKPLKYTDKKTGKVKRRSIEGKNVLFRKLVLQAHQNISFSYFLADSWYCNKENIKFLRSLGISFIMAVKSNFSATLTQQDKQKGNYRSIEELGSEGCTVSVWLKGLDFALNLTKLVFKNGGGVTGTLYLVSNDLNMDSCTMATIYKKRWKVELYHKTLKSYTALTKCPARSLQSQKSHFIAVLIAFIKWEMLSQKNNIGHEALKLKIYLNATKAGFRTLKELSTSIAA
ncbi:MAG: IS701 family transposase [Bacteroidia bacterium]